MLVPQRYEVKATAYFSSGTLDISGFIRSIEVSQNMLTSANVLTKLTLYNYSFLQRDLLYIELTIKTILHKHKCSKIKTFTIVPKLNSVTTQSSELMPKDETKNVGTINKQNSYFYFKSVYDSINYLHEPILAFDVPVGEILHRIKPPNTVMRLEPTCCKAFNVYLDQVYVKKQEFLKTLSYLEVWFQISKPSFSWYIIPYEPDLSKAFIRLTNVTVHFRRDQYDKMIYVRYPPSQIPKQLLEEESDKYAVTELYVISRNTNIHPRCFHIITHPKTKLFVKHKHMYDDIINHFAMTYLHYDKVLENNTVYKPTHTDIIDHPGPVEVVESLVAADYSRNVHIQVVLEDQPNIFFAWPSQIIKLKTFNADDYPIGGMYFCYGVTHMLSREESRSWKQSSKLDLIRANTFTSV